MTGFDDLPFEILQDIVSLVIQSYPKRSDRLTASREIPTRNDVAFAPICQLIHLSHISSVLRSVILATPELWTALDFSYDVGNENDRDVVGELVRRSGSRDVTLVLVEHRRSRFLRKVQETDASGEITQLDFGVCWEWVETVLPRLKSVALNGSYGFIQGFADACTLCHFANPVPIWLREGAGQTLRYLEFRLRPPRHTSLLETPTPTFPLDVASAFPFVQDFRSSGLPLRHLPKWNLTNVCLKNTHIPPKLLYELLINGNLESLKLVDILVDDSTVQEDASYLYTPWVTDETASLKDLELIGLFTAEDEEKFHKLFPNHSSLPPEPRNADLSQSELMFFKFVDFLKAFRIPTLEKLVLRSGKYNFELLSAFIEAYRVPKITICTNLRSLELTTDDTDISSLLSNLTVFFPHITEFKAIDSDEKQVPLIVDYIAHEQISGERVWPFLDYIKVNGEGYLRQRSWVR
ncbi:hypothetical protein CC1G_02782 [Coprinopsis cinerea okayama7|uniref:F-box domain-containing protein n=1 Tax=Coprinopsis cinerea (strain Okayama-7 / 130 / ATCC MYA-4618 / FGSC 9003) TaxID=240176 RepID=A8N012_COPC7|nr:hypothetical protein CC1G_02782 [Coprinopsis cinerea okayama7\|eukprot:XP_001828201.1 hypothetical protein CC1G_02782 [Coprinopsis cinerea okayama7\